MANYLDVNANSTFAPDRSVATITVASESSPLTAVTSGDLVVTGDVVGIATGDYDASLGQVEIKLNCFQNLEVSGESYAGGNVAVAQRNLLFLDPATQDGSNNDYEINRDWTNGIPIGYAMETVGSGLTATIGVEVDGRLAPLWADLKLLIAAMIAAAA
jgi:predicted RecA/RadA family phage recombinase